MTMEIQSSMSREAVRMVKVERNKGLSWVAIAGCQDVGCSGVMVSNGLKGLLTVKKEEGPGGKNR